ncbi:MAG: hypothetical protein QXL54_04865, partial [Candidatus Bathyarchaeia archaeon]
NEFPERTQIEPCFDATGFTRDSYYLYNLTRNYIAELKGIEASSAPTLWYHDPKTFLIVMGILAFCVIVGYAIYKRM